LNEAFGALQAAAPTPGIELRSIDPCDLAGIDRDFSIPSSEEAPGVARSPIIR
jgi:hypothetical protein